MIDQKPKDELHEAIELFYFAYRAFTDRPDRILERRGLGRMHHRILYFIGSRSGISVGGLLAVLAISKQALNGPLRQLIELKLVETAADKDDRRLKKLRLTPEGAALESELSGAQIAYLKTAFARTSSWDVQGWRRVMQELGAP
jgi:DNA-binding MarR family transcriptional regulator